MPLIIIDKPKGITSHDVIYQLRKITGIKKIGHAGTLDPNATGVLVVGIGRDSTKKLGEITKNTKKQYIATLELGEERDTDDVEGEVLARSQLRPTINDIEKVVKKYVGKINQTPPAFSAVKIKGKKAYELARIGKAPNLKARKVDIYSLQLNSFDFPKLVLLCDVGSGTFIRSLARDIGRDLKTFAYLRDLRRTKVGKYSDKFAVSLSKLTSDNWEQYIVK